MRDLGLEVQLLEELGGDCEAAGRMAQVGFVDVVVGLRARLDVGGALGDPVLRGGSRHRRG